MVRRIAIVGHVTALPNAIDLPTNERAAKALVGTYNYTRVATPQGQLVDHVEWLKKSRGLDKGEPFSVWEMKLCAGLLLRSYLERHGFETTLVNFLDSDNFEDEMADLANFDPDVVVLSTTFVLTRKHLKTVSTRLRKHLPGAVIIAGGHHVFTELMKMTSIQKVEYLDSVGLDAFVEDSQGEKALLEYCRRYPDQLDGIANLVWRDQAGECHVNERVPEENDIADTRIDLSGIDPESAVHIRTARSCSFKCAFCSYPSIAGPLALLEIEKTLETLQQAIDVGVKALFFVDDTFNVPKDRFEQLLDGMIERGISLPWYSFIRCQYLDEDLVDKMKMTGCAGVFLGVESGSDSILKAMKKGAISRFYWDGLRWLKARGIVTVGSFIIGYPTETPDTVEETREFITKSGLDYYFLQPFYYLHHTPIHKKAGKYGLSGEGLYWSHDTMNWEQAVGHIHRLFLEIEESVFVNPDYTLWEVAYLRTKGLTLEEIRDYRREVNDLTRDQMARFGIYHGPITSRTQTVANA